MNILAYIMIFGYVFQHFIRKIFRMWRCESEPHIRKCFGWYFKQFSKSYTRIISQLESLTKTLRVLMISTCLFTINSWYIMITINILSQKSDLFDTIILENLYFFQYSINISTSFTTSNKRYDTKWTHIIASSHDW